MRMLAAILLSCLLVALHPASAEKQVAVFAGAWHWEKGEESLDLVLKQSGAELTGYHDAVGQQGMKVDAADDSGTPSIAGKIEGHTAFIGFRSGFPDSNGVGSATLTLRGKYLYWKITASKGEHYLPLKACLSRVPAAVNP